MCLLNLLKKRRLRILLEVVRIKISQYDVIVFVAFRSSCVVTKGLTKCIREILLMLIFLRLILVRRFIFTDIDCSYFRNYPDLQKNFP